MTDVVVPPEPGTEPRKRRLSLRRRSLKLLLDLMGRQESPERVAAAVALGVGIGLSPFIGFHFLLAIVLASLFRLSRLDTVLGSLVGNPWTLPPFFAVGYRVGRALLGYSTTRVPPLQWERILHQDFWISFRGPGFRPRLTSFLLGTTLLAAHPRAGGVLDDARRSPPLPSPLSPGRREGRTSEGTRRPAEARARNDA